MLLCLGLPLCISKLLGTLQKIPLQNVAGDVAFGIYNAVYPLYILILFAATAGFPVAVSKFVAERVMEGDHPGAKRIVYVSSALLMSAGLLLFLLLYFGAETIAGWIGISQTVTGDPKCIICTAPISGACRPARIFSRVSEYGANRGFASD